MVNAGVTVVDVGQTVGGIVDGGKLALQQILRHVDDVGAVQGQIRKGPGKGAVEGAAVKQGGSQIHSPFVGHEFIEGD